MEDTTGGGGRLRPSPLLGFWGVGEGLALPAEICHPAEQDDEVSSVNAVK